MNRYYPAGVIFHNMILGLPLTVRIKHLVREILYKSVYLPLGCSMCGIRIFSLRNFVCNTAVMGFSLEYCPVI